MSNRWKTLRDYTRLCADRVSPFDAVELVGQSRPSLAAKTTRSRAAVRGAISGCAVVAAYTSRPPYPDVLVSLIADLAGRIKWDDSRSRLRNRRTRATDCPSRPVTAVDHAERMIARARMLPGGEATNLEWIVGHAENARLYGKASLVVAAESFHWFDWDLVCGGLTQCVPSPLLVIVEDRREADSPWAAELGALVAEFSTNRDFQPYDLIGELVCRNCYKVEGRTTLGPETFVQSIDDYITSIHSRNGLSLDRMSVSAARKFDLAMRSAVASYAVDNLIELHIETRVTWGRASYSDERNAASITS